MSIFLQLRIEVEPALLERFLEALEKHLIPFNESLGLRLQGVFVQTYGPLKPAVILDVWEAPDMARASEILERTDHFDHPDWQAYLSIARKAIIKEEMTFWKKLHGRMPLLFSTEQNSETSSAKHHPTL